MVLLRIVIETVVSPTRLVYYEVNTKPVKWTNVMTNEAEPLNACGIMTGSFAGSPAIRWMAPFLF
ncbi:unnamed protein product [Clavelina lepadiformis]|uniref:Uncharacterized protein n=1 Tax=Clavelina lepadiformis TaxID=159417 RepID=A0ABP0GYJ1_CLALP